MPATLPFAAPDCAHPLILPDGSRHAGTVFLRAILSHPRIEAGDYSYAHAFDPPPDGAGWAARLAPHLRDDSPERLILGRFCQIADGVRFITASANHRRDGISTFPFAIFRPPSPLPAPSLPGPGPDTVIGHDVWLGQGATVLPGARIGSGVIVGAGAVVGGKVPDYAIVAGNPARVVRMRFGDETVARLLDLAWWDWPIGAIVAAEAAIAGGDVAALAAAAPGAGDSATSPRNPA